MHRLIEIRDFIINDYQSLTKHLKRPRTHQNIELKTRLLREHLEEFEEILNEYGKTFETDDYNKYTDIFDQIKTKAERGIAILERTPVIPPKGKQRVRRNSDYLSDSIKEFAPLRDLEFPLSSTLLYDDEHKREDFNKTGFEEQIEKVKAKSLKLSSALEEEFNTSKKLKDSCIVAFIKEALQQYKIKMANATALMKDAIQCIPEYRGSVDELEPFLVQIQTFSEQIAVGQSERPLLNVVLTKNKELKDHGHSGMIWELQIEYESTKI